MARISLRQLAKNEGVIPEDYKAPAIDSPAVVEWLGTFVMDGVAPACCDEGCEVEPDGTCEHGAPSALLAAGMI